VLCKSTLLGMRLAMLCVAEDDLRIETCRSDFKCFNVKFYIGHLSVNNLSAPTKCAVRQ